MEHIARREGIGKDLLLGTWSVKERKRGKAKLRLTDNIKEAAGLETVLVYRDGLTQRHMETLQ